MSVTEVPDGKVFQAIYLHADALALAHLFKTTAQVGLGALLMLSNVFKERFRLLAIDLTLDALKTKL